METNTATIERDPGPRRRPREEGLRPGRLAAAFGVVGVLLLGFAGFAGAVLVPPPGVGGSPGWLSYVLQPLSYALGAALVLGAVIGAVVSAAVRQAVGRVLTAVEPPEA